MSNEDEHLPMPLSLFPNITEPLSTEDCGASEKKEDEKKEHVAGQFVVSENPAKEKLHALTVSRFRTVILTVLSRHRMQFRQGLGHRVMGTLFGYRKGHVHFAFQKEPGSEPAILIELTIPISGLVREMASGLVRIALECDKDEEKQTRLLEQPVWRTYCNGKKCGFATRRECGAKEWKILKALEPTTTGAGVLPANNGSGGAVETEGEVMYMRAKFERVVGSRDSEAFYMMNPDSNGAPELSIYLLRM